MADPPPKSFHLTPSIHAYVVAHTEPLDEVQEWLIDQTLALGAISRMQIAPEQGALMTLLAKLLDAREIVEVGTFTGYSAICLARGLAPGGRLLCCDVSEEWTSLARRAWDRAGLSDRIELRIAPAIETLRDLPDSEFIDLSFIDADKPGYLGYYEELVRRTRPGGMIAADNVLWSGAVADPTVVDDDTEALRAFNVHVLDDPRVETVMLPIADGVTLLRKHPR